MKTNYQSNSSTYFCYMNKVLKMKKRETNIYLTALSTPTSLGFGFSQNFSLAHFQ